MKEPTEEQVKEFWEWCGFTRSNSQNNYIAGRVWHYPNGTEEWNFPIPIDLNNLFKYAVPIVYKAGLQIVFQCLSTSRYDCYIADPYERKSTKTITNTDPALALFWAIREVIKSE